MYRQPNFTKFEHNNVDRCRHVNVWDRIFKILPSGVVFPKNEKILTKFQRLATSGRHNSAMITDHQKFTTK